MRVILPFVKPIHCVWALEVKCHLWYKKFSVNNNILKFIKMSFLNNNGFWEEFINIYKLHPELWDVSSQVYKYRKRKNQAWELLVEKMKEIDPCATLDIVKNKINFMRSSFRRELRKIKESERSSATRKSLYVPSLWYFNNLLFLKELELPKHGISTLDLDLDSCIFEFDAIETPRKKKSEKKEKKKLAKTIEQPQKVKTIPNIFRNNYDAEIYARSWAASYRKLSYEQRIYAMKAIEEVLTQGQLGNLTLNSFSYNPCACQMLYKVPKGIVLVKKPT